MGCIVSSPVHTANEDHETKKPAAQSFSDIDVIAAKSDSNTTTTTTNVNPTQRDNIVLNGPTGVQAYLDNLRKEIGSKPAAQPKGRPNDVSWTSIAIFVSSTFQDMANERRVINEEVIPRLRIACRSHMVDVIAIDLQWGVVKDTPAAETMRICLGELHRLYERNGAPFFLYLGGERLGWVPNGSDVPGDVREKYQWIDGSSMTGMEVTYGALRSSNPNASFFFRRHDTVSQFLNKDDLTHYEEAVSENREKQRGFISLLRETMSVEAVREFTWDVAMSRFESSGSTILSPSGPVSSATLVTTSTTEALDLSAFREAVFDRLHFLIRQQFPKFEASLLTIDKLTTHRLQHRQFLEGLLAEAVERNELLSRALNAIESKFMEGGVVVLEGEGGSGKSVALASIANFYTKNCIPLQCVLHYMGMGHRSNEIGSLARRLIRELRCGEGKIPEASRNPLRAAAECSTLLERAVLPHRTVIMVDNIDRMISPYASFNQNSLIEARLSWLPKAAVARGMVIVVTASPGPEVELIMSRYNSNNNDNSLVTKLELQQMDADEGRIIVTKMLKRRDKRFSKDQLDLFISKKGCSSPLWMRMAIDRLSRTSVFETIDADIGNLPDTLETLISAEIELAIKTHPNAKHHIQALLTTSGVSRMGLLQHEAAVIVPAFAGLIHSKSEEVSSLEFGSPMPSLHWVEFTSSLESLFQETPPSGLHFIKLAHTAMWDAVLRRYGEDATSVARRILAEFFSKKYPERKLTSSKRRAYEGPFQWMRIGDAARLGECLCDKGILKHLWERGEESGKWEMMGLWRAVGYHVAGKLLPDWVKSKIVPNCNSDKTYAVVKRVWGLLKEMGRYDSALEVLVVSNDAVKEEDGDGWLVHSLAVTHEILGNHEDALKHYQSVLEIKKSQHGDNHRSVAVCHNNIANIHQKQQQYSEALQRYQEALRIFEGVNSKSNIATCHNNMGVMHRAQGNVKEALEHYTAALDMFTELYGQHSADVAMCLNNIGVLHRIQGNYEEALAKHNLALAVFQHIYGDEHPDTAMCISNVADVYKEANKGVEALEQYDLALGLRVKMHGGSNHSDVAVILLKMSKVLEMLNRHDEALQKNEEAIHILHDLYREEYQADFDDSLLRTASLKQDTPLSPANMLIAKRDHALHVLKAVIATGNAATTATAQSASMDDVVVPTTATMTL